MKHKRCFTGCINENKLSCRKFVIRHLPIFVSDRTVNERKEIRRSRIKCGMTPLFNNGGFTLIELLVVVLIIGILAAVALPQYQKVVERSKATQAITLLKSVYQAAKAYQLANGSWPTDFDSLAVTIPFTGHVNAANIGHARQGFSNSEWSIQLQAPMNIVSTANGAGVFITRISGPYAGGAFTMYDQWPTSIANLPTGQIVCRESKHPSDYTEAARFKKNRGDYCTKILKGALVNTGSTDNYFLLP